MRKIISMVGYPVKSRDVLEAVRGLGDPAVIRRFMSEVGRLTESEAVFASDSGNACFYVILKTLQKLFPDRQEVVLAAYTAPSLVVTIRKAGLTPILCDVSLEDFNADPEGVLQAITRRTLCVLAVHMFGNPWLQIIKVKRGLPSGLVVVEDCAQAMGARINNIPVGLFGDVAFFSFNRGKNLPTLTGGVVTTFNPPLAVHLRDEAKALLRPRGLWKEAVSDLKCAALRLAFDPAWYGLLRALVARFKDTSVPSDIAIEAYSRFRAAFGLSLLGRWKEAEEKRFVNGCYLQKALSGLKGVIVPKQEAGVIPAFNRMPVVFQKTEHVEQAARLLKDKGIESSRMYNRPLHHIFDLGHDPSDFPNAVFLAKNILTLPVHALVRQGDLEVIADVVKKVVDK